MAAVHLDEMRLGVQHHRVLAAGEGLVDQASAQPLPAMVGMRDDAADAVAAARLRQHAYVAGHCSVGSLEPQVEGVGREVAAVRVEVHARLLHHEHCGPKAQRGVEVASGDVRPGGRAQLEVVHTGDDTRTRSSVAPPA